MYTKNKAFDKSYYLALIEQATQHHNFIDRKDVNELLWDKLPDWMDEEKKKSKITSLLTELRKNGTIRNDGSDYRPKWVHHSK